MKILILVLLLTIQAGAQIVLTPQNTVTLKGEVTQSSAGEVIRELYRLDSERESAWAPLYLVLDTPGGSIDAGLLLIQAAQNIENLNTVTIFAASMGSAIVEALPGKRYILESGILMFHRARATVEGQIEDGEIESRVSMIKSLVRVMEEKNSRRMSMPLDEYKRRVKDEYWMVGHSAVIQNAADEVTTIKCSKELLQAKEVKKVQVFIFSFEVEYSKCPLLREEKTVKQDEQDLYNKYKKKSIGVEYVKTH